MTPSGQFGGQMGRQHEPWFVEMSPYHPANYGAYPEYLFHHADGPMIDRALVFEAPHLALPQGLNEERVLDRAALRDGLERQSRLYDATAEDAGFDRYRQAAISLLTESGVRDAFDLQKADAKSLDRYGRNSFGWSLLMARQLVESGVSLVQLNLGNNETWDTHQAAFPNLKNILLPPMDRAVSALLDDLDARGLLDETLIVMGSEFGRTPKVSKIAGATLPGRDHWGASQTVFLAGGGVRGGTVIGATDRNGAYPAEAPQRPENLAATMPVTRSAATVARRNASVFIRGSLGASMARRPRTSCFLHRMAAQRLGIRNVAVLTRAQDSGKNVAGQGQSSTVRWHQRRRDQIREGSSCLARTHGEPRYPEPAWRCLHRDRCDLCPPPREAMLEALKRRFGANDFDALLSPLTPR